MASAHTKIRLEKDSAKKLLTDQSQNLSQNLMVNLDQPKNQRLAKQVIREDQETIRSVIAKKTTASTPSRKADRKLSSMRMEKATSTRTHNSMVLNALLGMKLLLLTVLMITADLLMMHPDGALSHSAMLTRTARETTSNTLVSSATITNCGSVMVTAMETIT